MKLTRDNFDRLDKAARQHARLSGYFAKLLSESKYLTEPATQVKGISFKPSNNEGYFDVTFIGITIRFRFDSFYGSDGSLVGRVVVERTGPMLSIAPDVIGTFSFNGIGDTSFDDPDGEEKANIESYAGFIILYFLDQALANPPPLPSGCSLIVGESGLARWARSPASSNGNE